MRKNTMSVLGFLLLLSCSMAPRHAADNATMHDQGNGTCLDSETGLTWQATPESLVFYSWEEAQQYVRELDLGGYADWRLPTYDELYVLHDTFERRLNGDCHIKPEICVWTGSREEDGRAGYWYSYPTCGGVDYGFVRKKQGRVRAVRP